MTALLRCGVILVVHEDGESEQMAIGDGFAEVSQRTVKLIVEFFNGRPDVSEDRAHGAMKRALDRLNQENEGIDVARARAALCRAIVRLRVCGCGCSMCRSQDHVAV